MHLKQTKKKFNNLKKKTTKILRAQRGSFNKERKEIGEQKGNFFCCVENLIMYKNRATTNTGWGGLSCEKHGNFYIQPHGSSRYDDEKSIKKYI